MTAADAKKAAAATFQTVERFRSEEEFSTFWKKAVGKSQELQLIEPRIPRSRRPPQRIDSGCTPSSFNSPKEYYRKVYFEVADTIVGEILNRRTMTYIQRQKNYYYQLLEVEKYFNVTWKQFLSILVMIWTI